MSDLDPVSSTSADQADDELRAVERDGAAGATGERGDAESEKRAAHETQPPESTSPAVTHARELLARLPELDLADHPDVYQQIHTELQGALSAIDDA
jgi:hypothetical protein